MKSKDLVYVITLLNKENVGLIKQLPAGEEIPMCVKKEGEKYFLFWKDNGFVNYTEKFSNGFVKEEDILKFHSNPKFANIRIGEDVVKKLREFEIQKYEKYSKLYDSKFPENEEEKAQ